MYPDSFVTFPNLSELNICFWPSLSDNICESPFSSDTSAINSENDVVNDICNMGDVEVFEIDNNNTNDKGTRNAIMRLIDLITKIHQIGKCKQFRKLKINVVKEEILSCLTTQINRQLRSMYSDNEKNNIHCFNVTQIEDFFQTSADYCFGNDNDSSSNLIKQLGKRKFGLGHSQ